MEVNLVVVQGKPEGMVISLKGPKFLIGRGSACNLRPNSDLVSKMHCGLQILDDKVILHDLGSKNGTFLNHERIEDSTEVQDGDLLRVGPLVFAIQLKSRSRATTPVLDRETDAASWLEELPPTRRDAAAADTMISKNAAGEETIIESGRKKKAGDMPPSNPCPTESNEGTALP